MSIRLFALLSFLSVHSAWTASLTPYALECEARPNPIGIDARSPRLSWKLQSSTRGDLQAAYEVNIASSEAGLASGQPDLWQSGLVKSQESIWIPYGGNPLRSFQKVWWKVRVSSAHGDSSAWSEPATWTTALLNKTDHRGGWISATSKQLVAGPMPIFRREIDLQKKVKSAIVAVSGLGLYELSLNGTKIGDRVLTPAWTNYRKSVRYDAFDITSFLLRGRNALGLMLGNGPFNVVGGRYSKYTASFGQPRVWLQLHIEFADGTNIDIATDRTWRVHDGPVIFSDFYGGEDYDARLEPASWNRPGFDDSSWPIAESADDPGGEFVADSTPAAEIITRYQPVKITEPKPGIFIYDLGQNFAGWPELSVSGAKGTSVRLTPGELLDSSGLVTQRSSGSPVWYAYTLRGGPVETWSPRFSFYGFRYVQMEGAAPAAFRSTGLPVVTSLVGNSVHLRAAKTGYFSSSNETLNRIHRLIVSAMESNLQQVLTDCPHREKLGWLEQSYLMGPSLLFDFDLRTFLPKVMRDIREAQTNDGLIPDIAPEYVQFAGGFRDSPEWGSAGVMLPWFSWQWYGDRSSLEASYPSMKKYVEYLQSRTEAGLLNFGLGDWYDIAPGPPGPSKLTPKGLTSTATYFADLEVAVQTARLLGRDTDADSFRILAEKERAAFDTAFYNTKSNTYANGSQTSLAMPLMTSLAADDRRSSLLDGLIKDIRAHGNHTTAGDIGYRYVIEALTGGGRSDVVFDMATERTAPSYAAQLAAGATTLTEAWDANPESSQNHLMLGHMEEWFYNGLAGIKPVLDTNAPVSHLVINPSLVGDITRVDATWESVRGPVIVHWSIQQEILHLQLDIPPGLDAEIHLPTLSAKAIQNYGRPVGSDHQVQFIRYQDGKSVVHAPSGHYELELKLASIAK